MLRNLFTILKSLFSRQKSNLLPSPSQHTSITLDDREGRILIAKNRLESIATDCNWYAISFNERHASRTINEYCVPQSPSIPSLLDIKNERRQKHLQELKRKRDELQEQIEDIKTHIQNQDSESAQNAMANLLEFVASFDDLTIKDNIECLNKELADLKQHEEENRYSVIEAIEQQMVDESDSLTDSDITEDEPQMDQKDTIDYTKTARDNYNHWLEEQHKLLYVLYNIEGDEIGHHDPNYYFRIIVPKHQCVVFPYRKHRTRRRGYCERFFEEVIKSKMSDIADVLGDVSLVLFDDARPYEPDIAIICNSSKNIRIDIEIDEPYTGWDHKPIHFLGCGDEFRDEHIANAGWIVMRFAEKQVILYTDACVAEIFKLIHHLDDTIPIPQKYQRTSLLFQMKRWTKLEAQSMAFRHERESLLNHQFSELFDDEDDKNTVVRQRTAEKFAAQQVDCLGVQNSPTNIDKSSTRFDRDKELFFFDKEHIYIYKNQYQLKSVSDIVEMFFEPFDEINWSWKKSRQNNISQIKQLELWECKGNLSKEVGSFMHRQIQASFNDLPIENFYSFEYLGSEYHYQATIDISPELNYFRQFIKDYDIKPFRTEWSIYDLDLKIAGTIDLICRNDGAFDIFDWKRSEHINVSEHIYSYGINGMYNLGNTRYNKYCLQINLYRYILEKNYGIKVNNMFLVVLHSAYSEYKVYNIPEKNEEMDIIVRFLTENNGE